jgi:enoyl-[acyl-carrier protein] reductase I
MSEGKGLLAGKVGVVCGVANKRSIAWAIAQAWAREGATLIFNIRASASKRMWKS